MKRPWGSVSVRPPEPGEAGTRLRGLRRKARWRIRRFRVRESVLSSIRSLGPCCQRCFAPPPSDLGDPLRGGPKPLGQWRRHRADDDAWKRLAVGGDRATDLEGLRPVRLHLHLVKDGFAGNHVDGVLLQIGPGAKPGVDHRREHSPAQCWIAARAGSSDLRGGSLKKKLPSGAVIVRCSVPIFS